MHGLWTATNSINRSQVHRAGRLRSKGGGLGPKTGAGRFVLRFTNSAVMVPAKAWSISASYVIIAACTMQQIAGATLSALHFWGGGHGR